MYGTMFVKMAWIQFYGRRILLFTFIFVCICNGSVYSDRVCVAGLQTIGYTVPQHDILIEYGNPLDILCILGDNYIKKHGPNASDNLYFTRNTETLPSEMIEIINSSTIKLHIDKPPKSSNDVYTCNLKPENTLVCLNTVIVGIKPLPVEDFNCIGYNYENLTCSWTPPENYATTTYNLTYYFPGRASRYLRYNCPEIKDTDNRQKSCFWSIATVPQYRQAQITYYFTLNMTNRLGSNQIHQTFSHFKHVLPGPPVNLTYVNTTTESILLRWVVPLPMQTFPPGLHHRVMYQSEYEPRKWQLGGLVTHSSNEMQYNLTGLKYAHALYDIRVSMRSSVALPGDETMWSRNSSVTIRTMSKVPGAPPNTSMGSFEIVYSGVNLQYRDIYIYWQQISEEIKNGEGFSYNVSVDTHGSITPVEITSAYAKFKRLNVSDSYTFNVWSQNVDGKSKRNSTVFVSSQNERVGEPMSFIKVAYDDGKYELSWEPPKKFIYHTSFKKPVHIENYTIFWCSHDRDRPYQCTGHLKWIDVPSNLTVFNITVSEANIHQFAISANTKEASSGMVWAACTVIHNKDIGKMKSVWINRIGSTFIEVGWKLDCSDRIGSVVGFIIYYCPIVSPREITCKGPQKNLTIHGDPTLIHGNITDLTPYTTYMLTVAVITKHTTFSQQSDPLYNTTLEAAPSSPPLDVRITEVSNTSIGLEWSPPTATNGHLRYYEIKYNNSSVKVEPKLGTKCVLSNLTSYELYDIVIFACTVSCSEPSIPLNQRTEVGYPGKIKKPTIDSENGSYIVVKWERPTQPRGKNDLYEIQFTEKLQFENKTVPIVNVTDTKHVIEDCGSDGKYNTFYVSVRAVNLDNGARYEGPWSDELESYCRTHPKFLIWVLAPVTIALILALSYMLKKMYFYCQRMRDVEVKLPPGLAPVVTTDLGHWGAQKGQEELDHLSPADEELLLEKMCEKRHPSGDSSGCSSGHESVTSSLESGTHISNTSDSGTEQPHTPTTDELRKNSLRLRNVSALRPAASKGYVTMPTDALTMGVWSPKNNSGNYCVLGVDPNPAVEATSGYVPVAPITTESKNLYGTCETGTPPSPYVMTGNLTKPPDSGYVPLNCSESIAKSPTYVMAGNKSILVPDLVQRDALKLVPSENKPSYVQISDSTNNMLKQAPESLVWHQNDSLSGRPGYVSIGDTSNLGVQLEHTKGYVQHRHFDAKPFKED